MSCCINELRDKEVVNVCDGRRLGCVNDVEIDITSGRLVAIIVPGENKPFSFTRSHEIVIPWDKIEKIGEDIILVNLGIIPLNDECRKPEKRSRYDR